MFTPAALLFISILEAWVAIFMSANLRQTQESFLPAFFKVFFITRAL